jgi:glycine cleavage system pyridoxal-binding protein P
MHICTRRPEKKGQPVLRIEQVLPQTIDLLHFRATPVGIRRWWWATTAGRPQQQASSETMVQYPPPTAGVRLREFIMMPAKTTLCGNGHDCCPSPGLTSPGSRGRCVRGQLQRFGVPMGYGGTREALHLRNGSSALFQPPHWPEH